MSRRADVGPEPHYHPPEPPADELSALAARYDMAGVGVRPRLGAYIADVWRHRHLMWSLAKGELIAQNQDNYLGWLWSIINPVLLATTYYLVFGLLLNTSRGVDNFITFLAAGLFTFVLLSAALTNGSKSLLAKQSMMRSMQFPRVLLPITTVLSSFVQQLPPFAVLIAIAFWQEGRLTWALLLYPLALVLVLLLGTGLSMILAPLVHWSRDVANLMPMAVRMLRYVSGVFFSIEGQMSRFSGGDVWVIQMILQYQPFAVVLSVVRECLMQEFPPDPVTWLVAAGWAIGLFVVGFLVFWRGEGTYGRT